MTPHSPAAALPPYRLRPRVNGPLSHYLQFGFAHFLMYVFGRFGPVRTLMVRLYHLRVKPARTLSGSTLIEKLDANSAAARIARDGVHAGLALRADAVDQLLAFAHESACFGDDAHETAFLYAQKDVAEKELGRRFRVGRYNYTLNACPVLQSLASDPQLLAIARGYLQAEPVLIGARMWWNFAVPPEMAAQAGGGQQFHYDLDGYRAVTFFFYLTDTGPDCGPHLYVKGSHRQKPLRHLLSIYKKRSDAEIEQCYGQERQLTICGRAGFGFAEDTFGYHKGLTPQRDDRLVVQVRYGLRDYGTGRND